MTMSVLKMVEAGLPSQDEQAAAQAATRMLARFGNHDRVHVEVRGEERDASETLVLPATAVRLLTDILGHLAEGRSVTVTQEDAMLTTQRAASMLNVSRPHLIKLLDLGEIPHQKVGTHRRISLRDLRSYRLKQTKASAAALDELVSQAEEAGMGYQPP